MTGAKEHVASARDMTGRLCYVITHPDVIVSRDVPVPEWPLSERGRERMVAGLMQPWIAEVTSVYCSNEQKAIDAASILARYLSLPFFQVEGLGENDRSATGFLPQDEFERTADEFFEQPERSVRGWERAVDAQRRFVEAVSDIIRADAAEGSIAIVAHGAVGTLLYCSLAGSPISRQWDQPPNGGGNYFCFSLQPPRLLGWWRAIDGETA